MTFLRLLLTLVGLIAIASGLLFYRQQRLQTRHEIAQMHGQLQQKQATLWRQQLDVAAHTTPDVLRKLAGLPDEPPQTTVKGAPPVAE